MNNSHLTWLDLFSGLGGASQPALDRGWRVIRIDIERKFRPDIVADVRNLPLRPFHVDVLWASFPCQDFSKWGLRCFYPEPPNPDMTLALATKAIIDAFKPRMWVVENVWAARPFVNPIFGPVRARVPGHVFWSNSLLLLPNVESHKIAPSRHFGTDPRRYFKLRGKGLIGTGHNGFSAAEAARIPPEIGEAICRAVEARSEQPAAPAAPSSRQTPSAKTEAELALSRLMR